MGWVNIWVYFLKSTISGTSQLGWGMDVCNGFEGYHHKGEHWFG